MIVVPSSIRAFALAVAVASVASGCSSLAPEDQIRLSNFKQNSKRFYDDGDFRRAVDQCRKGLAIDPEDQSLRQVLGYSLLRQDRPTEVAESVAVFEKLIDDESDFDFRNHLGIGEAQLKLAQFRARQEDLIRADEKLTPDERAQKLGRCQEERDRAFASAEKSLVQVLDSPRGKNDSDAQNALARLYATQGRYEEGADVLRSLTATLENSIHLREEQVSTETLPADKKEMFEKTLKRLKDQRIDALGLLATMAAKLARWEEAVSVYARIESEDAMRPADWYNRGVAYESLGARDAAIADFEQFLRKAAQRNIPYADIGSRVSDAMDRIAKLKTAPIANASAPASQPAVANIIDPITAWPEEGAASQPGSEPTPAWPEPTNDGGGEP